MHKEQASILFLNLGDPYRVKIVKMLYHNNELSLKELADRIGINTDDLLVHLDMLVNNNLLIENNQKYCCNKVLVDELMSFIPTKCSCVR